MQETDRFNSGDFCSINFLHLFNLHFVSSFQCCRKRSASTPVFPTTEFLRSVPKCPRDFSKPRLCPPPKPSSSSSPPPSSSTSSSSASRPTRRRCYALIPLSLPPRAAMFSSRLLPLLRPGPAASRMFASGTVRIRRVLSPSLIALRLISPLLIHPFRR